MSTTSSSDSSAPPPLEQRLLTAVRDGARPGAKTAVWLLSIMIPVSFGVFLLDWFGGLDLISRVLSPLFRALDLPGSAALVYLTSIVINIYSATAVMANLDLTVAALTTLALMTLIAHNFFVELAVMRSTGSSLLRMLVLRVLASLLAAWLLSFLLPATLDVPATGIAGAEGDAATATFGAALTAWLAGTGMLIAKVAAILLGLMIGERILQALGVIRWLGERLRPLMVVFGLPKDTAFLWLVSNTLGLAYGAGVLRTEVAEGRLSREDGDLLNHHSAISHSLLEDTLLYVALGVPALWIMVPRVALAVVAVWLRRAELQLLRRYQRSAGPAA